MRSINYFIKPGLNANTDSEYRSQVLNCTIKTVLDYFNISMKEIRSGRRTKNVVDARQALAYFLKKRTKLTLMAIGEIMKKDHTTIIYSISIIKDRLEVDEETQENIGKLNSLFGIDR